MTRLVTVVDVDVTTVPPEVLDAPVVDGPAPEGVEPGVVPIRSRPPVDDPREMSFSAWHVAVLDDGSRVTLLDDRGWGVHGPPDIWRRTSLHEIEADARMVVGPDEPFGGRSHADMKADHWADLAGVLRQHGVLVRGEDLARLPHDVELSERLRSRFTR